MVSTPRPLHTSVPPGWPSSPFLLDIAHLPNIYLTLNENKRILRRYGDKMKKSPKLTVLSIDGLSHSLLVRLMKEGFMPTFARLCEADGQLRTMRSEYPAISCVAWTSYATGMNPGKHGIYGFIDRKPRSYELAFPNGSNICGDTIWEILSRNGKKVFGMNVPCTYPPRKVNGILIGGFLAPSVDRIAYPSKYGHILKKTGYRIDVDVTLGRTSKKDFLKDLMLTLQKRSEAMFHFLGKEHWDFFHTHIMGTDRINHFLLRHYENDDPSLKRAFCEFYRSIDGVLTELVERIGEDAPLLVVSDHGFCTIKREVQLAKYLADTGWTVGRNDADGPLAFDPFRTKAFCLTPGRIYVNLAGREAQGCVPKEEYDEIRSSLIGHLMELRDSDNRQIIKRVLKRENVYWPMGCDGPANIAAGVSEPPYSMAPDLLAIPHDGYDLKMGMDASSLFLQTELEGMHTHHDAICFARGVSLPADNLQIRQLAGVILEALQVPPQNDMDLQPHLLGTNP